MLISPEVLGLVFFTALFLALFIVPVTIVLARKVGAVDVPKGRSSHSVPTTRLGGLGITSSLLLVCLMFLPFNAFAWAFLTGLSIVVITGLIDDVLDIGPRWKFAGQVMAAGAFVGLGGGSLTHLGSFLGGGAITLEAWSVPFTIFCMVGGMNAFNLSDGLDGLAAGVSAVAAVFFAYFSWHIGAVDLLLVCVALLGAVIGFLRYNSYPAKLFMGDSGSLALGYVLVAILVSGSQREGHAIPLVAWAMVLALPLLDTLLVMARRVRYGQSPFEPDRSHLHHRLMALGLTHPAVVATMYTGMATFGVLALVMLGKPEVYLFAALCLIGAVLFGGVSGLQHASISLKRPGSKRSYASVRQWPLFRQVARWVQTSTSPISLMLLLLLCVPAYFLVLPELNRHETLSLFFLAAVILFYGLQSAKANEGMLHGAVYVSVFALLFLYNLEIGSAPAGGAYLIAISIAAAAWVVMKIVFRRPDGVWHTSGFELLMVMLSWFLPFVLFEALRLPANVIDAGRMACLQVLPFILSAKIYFGVQPHGNRRVLGILAGTLVVIALRGGL